VNKNPLHLVMRIPVPWVFVLAYLAGVGVELFARSDRRPSRFGLGVSGAVLFFLGSVIAGWSLVIFRRARTTTVPGRASARLVTQGPYRLSRNPMYIGLTLAYLGEAGILGQAWPIAFLPPVLAYLNWVVIPVEEARLTEVFGSEYDQYRAKVRRWM